MARKVSKRNSPKKRSTRRRSISKNRSGLVCYKNKNKSVTCYKKKSARKSARKSAAKKVVYRYVYPKGPVAMPMQPMQPYNAYDNAQVYGCTRHMSESGCGFDPSCNWTASGCRRKVGVIAGKKFQGPMGPA